MRKNSIAVCLFILFCCNFLFGFLFFLPGHFLCVSFRVCQIFFFCFFSQQSHTCVFFSPDFFFWFAWTDWALEPILEGPAFLTQKPFDQTASTDSPHRGKRENKRRTKHHTERRGKERLIETEHRREAPNRSIARNVRTNTSSRDRDDCPTERACNTASNHPVPRRC